jgi:hypothetical protein
VAVMVLLPAGWLVSLPQEVKERIDRAVTARKFLLFIICW